MEKNLIAFKQWYDKLSPADKCTVWPPAASGAGTGLYNMSDEDLIEKFLKKRIKSGIDLIAEERLEQIEKHGRTVERDDKENYAEQLATGAEMLLAMSHEEGIDPLTFPDGWDHDICQHMLGKPYKERLIIAGALIAAEIDRLNYKS